MKHTEQKEFNITTSYRTYSKRQPKVLASYQDAVKAIENQEVFVFKNLWARKEKDVYVVFNLDQPVLLVRDICGIGYKFLSKNCGLNALLNDYQFELESEHLEALIDSKKAQWDMILNSPLPF